MEIERLRVEGQDSDQARALLQQGEAIRQETIRLLRSQGFNVDSQNLNLLKKRIQEE